MDGKLTPGQMREMGIELPAAEAVGVSPERLAELIGAAVTHYREQWLAKGVIDVPIKVEGGIQMAPAANTMVEDRIQVSDDDDFLKGAKAATFTPDDLDGECESCQ